MIRRRTCSPGKTEKLILSSMSYGTSLPVFLSTERTPWGGGGWWVFWRVVRCLRARGCMQQTCRFEQMRTHSTPPQHTHNTRTHARAARAHLAEEDHGAARPPQALVRRSGDDVGVLKRRRHQAGGDEAADVGHVGQEPRLRGRGGVGWAGVGGGFWGGGGGGGGRARGGGGCF